ncbi:hypothetical protein GN244_ATG12044 [Phytophthora infestans]|uniref:RxLR effector protein n=1 Tax=Phytophthora infestans TaxID=4787 RepID=A0A833WAY3_PHYIN|nr:hypothetical protein GN244_ATG12044 [Phytophthora infestans]KAF4133243.1 hypothetical protein GN958_ATG17589 [Phytophthora infestans]
MRLGSTFLLSRVKDDYDERVQDYSSNHGVESIKAAEEERVVNFSGFREWLKAPFKNWPHKGLSTRGETIPEGVAFDFAPETIRAMLKSKRVRGEMFKRWDNHRMEDIKLKIGQVEMSNDAVAKMLVNKKRARPFAILRFDDLR